MPAGIQVIRNGLVSTLMACGPWVANEISTCDYGIIERVSGCGILLHPQGDSPMEDLTMGRSNTTLAHWNIGGELYIRFTGDVPAFLSKIWQGMDDITTTINKDTTLQSTACFATLTGVSHTIQEGVEIGGQDFGVIHFQIEAQDF